MFKVRVKARIRVIVVYIVSLRFPLSMLCRGEASISPIIVLFATCHAARWFGTHCLPSWVTCRAVRWRRHTLPSIVSYLSCRSRTSANIAFHCELPVMPFDDIGTHCLPLWVTCRAVRWCWHTLPSIVSYLSCRSRMSAHIAFHCELPVMPFDDVGTYCLPSWVTCHAVRGRRHTLPSIVSYLSCRSRTSAHIAFHRELPVMPFEDVGTHCLPSWVDGLQFLPQAVWVWSRWLPNDFIAGRVHSIHRALVETDVVLQFLGKNNHKINTLSPSFFIFCFRCSPVT